MSIANKGAPVGAIRGSGLPADLLLSAMTQPSSVAIWKLGELAGSVANEEINPAQNGIHINVTLDNTAGPIAGSRAPLYVPANSSVTNIYSATLGTAVDGFAGTAGTVLIWAKIPTATWTNGALSRLIYIRAPGTGNLFYINKTATNNQFVGLLQAGGTSKSVFHTTSGPTGWVLFGIAWHKANDTFKVYFLESSSDGQVGTTQTGLGAWAGSGLDSDITIIGSNSASSPTQTIPANLAYAGLYSAELSLATIQSIMASTE